MRDVLAVVVLISALFPFVLFVAIGGPGHDDFSRGIVAVVAGQLAGYFGFWRNYAWCRRRTGPDGAPDPVS